MTFVLCSSGVQQYSLILTQAHLQTNSFRLNRTLVWFPSMNFLEFPRRITPTVEKVKCLQYPRTTRINKVLFKLVIRLVDKHLLVRKGQLDKIVFYLMNYLKCMSFFIFSVACMYYVFVYLLGCFFLLIRITNKLWLNKYFAFLFFFSQ